MKHKLSGFLLMVVIFECNGHGHVPILGNILSSARDHVEGVAGAVLGGLNLNLFGANRQNRPQAVPQKGPEEAIVVVVEEPDNGDYGNAYPGRFHHGPPPPPHHHHHHYPKPPVDYDSSPPPPPPHHHHPRPPPNYGSHPPPPPPPYHHHQKPPSRYGSYPPPPPHPPHHHYHQGPHDNHKPGYNNQNQRPLYNNEYGHNHNSERQENDKNFYGNNQNGRPYDNNNGNLDDNGYLANPKGTEQPNKYNNNPYDNVNTNQFNNNPTTENIKTPTPVKSNPLPKNDESNKATEKPIDNKPLFVPLNTDEYVYGGDKINISAPKRQTDKAKPEESDDEDFAIDVRLKDE